MGKTPLHPHPEAFIMNTSVYLALMNLSGEAAIHPPIELQTHHKATVYFAMKFNNLAAYY